MKQRLKNFFAAIGFRHMSVGGAYFFFANTAIMVLLIFQIGVFVPLIVLLLISGMIIWAHTQLDSLGVSDPERRVLLRQDAAWIGFSAGLGVIFIFSGACGSRHLFFCFLR